MSRFGKLNKDHAGAALLLVLGAVVLWMGLGYKVGNLNRAGAGFVPVVLGVLFLVVGLALGLTAGRTAEGGSLDLHTPKELSGEAGPQWRGWLCILGGVLAFVVLGSHGGLVPATFGSAFIAALGDRDNNVRDAALLGAGLAVFSALVFHFGLHLQLPLFQWL